MCKFAAPKDTFSHACIEFKKRAKERKTEGKRGLYM